MNIKVSFSSITGPLNGLAFPFLNFPGSIGLRIGHLLLVHQEGLQVKIKRPHHKFKGLGLNLLLFGLHQIHSRSGRMVSMVRPLVLAMSVQQFL